MSMPKSFHRLAAAVAACLVLAGTTSVQAYTITQTGNFTGTPSVAPDDDDTFHADVDLTGNLTATGGGAAYNATAKAIQPFVVTAPTVHPLSFTGGPQSVDSNPTGQGDFTLTDPNLHTLVDIQNLDVDLLNGQSVPFAIDTVDIFTNSKIGLLKDITIDVSATLSKLTFDQTGSSVLTPTGVGTGTFVVNGDLNGTASDLNAIVLQLLSLPLDPQDLTLPGALAGTYTITSVPGGRKISLDGSINLQLPLTLNTQLSTSNSDVVPLTISTTVDLAASLTIAVGFHLSTVVAPEPGSFVLLGIGLAALVPIIRHRRKK